MRDVVSTWPVAALGAELEAYVTMFASTDSHTSRAKRNDLDKFAVFVLSRRQEASIYSVTHSLLEEFRDHLLAEGFAVSTVSRCLATVKHFCKFAAQRHEGFINPAKGITCPVQELGEPDCFTDAEVERMLQHKVGHDDTTILRNKIIIGLLHRQGLRCAEVCWLQYGQLNQSNWTLEGFKRKGLRYDTQPLHSELIDLVQLYLPMRARLLTPTDTTEPRIQEPARYPLIVSTHSAKPDKPESYAINQHTIWRIVRELGNLAGVENAHPHRFRHTLGGNLYDSTKDILLTAQVLGHTSTTTTMRYARRSTEAKRNAIEGIKKK